MAAKKTTNRTPKQRWQEEGAKNVLTIVRAIRRIAAWDYNGSDEPGAKGVKYTAEEIAEMKRCIREELNACGSGLEKKLNNWGTNADTPEFEFGKTHVKKK